MTIGKKTRKIFLEEQNELKVMQTILSILSDTNILWQYDTSSHQNCSINNDVLQNFTISTGKHSCKSVFFNKVFLKKRLWNRCFPVIFAKLLRTFLLQKTFGRLLLLWSYKTSAVSLWRISIWSAAVLPHIIPETIGQPLSHTSRTVVNFRYH